VQENLKADKEVVEAAVRIDPDMYKFVHKELVLTILQDDASIYQ
jgi:hypothetical protein